MKRSTLGRKYWKNVWTGAWQNQHNDLYTQQRLRSAWASAQSDQSAWPSAQSAVCFMGSLGPNLSSDGQWWLWSDWADAQADPSPRWVHRSFCWFCGVAAQIYVFLSLWELFLVYLDHTSFYLFFIHCTVGLFTGWKTKGETDHHIQC